MEKITIMELLRYYVDRYDLPTEAMGNVDEVNEDGLKPYYTKVTRILQETTIGEITLWDAIKPAKGKRQISVEEFEKLCFPKWCAYIEKYYAGCYDIGALQADKERYAEEYRWVEIASEQAEKLRKELESGAYIPDPSDRTVNYPVSDEAVKATGHDMMIEALYDIFFERFRWDRLEADMRDAEVLKSNRSEEGFYTAELVRADTMLKSFRNYIGDRRK